METTMSESNPAIPAGATLADGIAHTQSPLSVEETVARLTEAIHGAGAKLFTVVDHSGEAQLAGLTLRDTKLVIFGNPAGGTPAMVASPLAAIDLPVKILVWQDDDGAVWMSHIDPAWLAARHGLTAEQAAPLGAPGKLAAKVAASAHD
jgi:uncharacterized protein (DUF302 family)